MSVRERGRESQRKSFETDRGNGRSPEKSRGKKGQRHGSSEGQRQGSSKETAATFKMSAPGTSPEASRLW